MPSSLYNLLDSFGPARLLLEATLRVVTSSCTPSFFVPKIFFLSFFFNSLSLLLDLIFSSYPGISGHGQTSCTPPAIASSHDFNGFNSSSLRLSFIFYLYFAHNFTFFCFSLAFFGITFFALPWARGARSNYHTEEARVYNSGTQRGCRACSFQFVAPHYQVCSFYNFHFSYVNLLSSTTGFT